MYAVLREERESRRNTRVCRRELWDLSQTEGWKVELPNIAATEPVESRADLGPSRLNALSGGEKSGVAAVTCVICLPTASEALD